MTSVPVGPVFAPQLRHFDLFYVLPPTVGFQVTSENPNQPIATVGVFIGEERVTDLQGFAASESFYQSETESLLVVEESPKDASTGFIGFEADLYDADSVGLSIENKDTIDSSIESFYVEES